LSVAHEVKGVVARSKGTTVEVDTVVVPDPGPGEVLVRVRACGVCHTDLLYREGVMVGEFPFLLGHEVAGNVEAVGDRVDGLEPGDLVVLAWRAPCGRCRRCRRGHPWQCTGSQQAGQRMHLADGTPLESALGIGGFAELTLVAAAQAVKVDPSVSPEAACLVGCGVTTGYGAALRAGRVQAGDRVAVFGCGGVGDAAIAACAMVGAEQVIAVDLDERKLAWAGEFGATDTVNAAETDPVAAIRELTGGRGVEVALEVVGHQDVAGQAFAVLDSYGVMVQVGVPERSMRMDLPLQKLFRRGITIRASQYGDCLPSRDFPVLVDLHLRGRFDLDRFVTRTIGLGEVEEAFATMRRGEVLRSVVVL
jgi:S-(hydroxymethyl)mycothiol dehydrogenase